MSSLPLEVPHNFSRKMKLMATSWMSKEANYFNLRNLCCILMLCHNMHAKYKIFVFYQRHETLTPTREFLPKCILLMHFFFREHGRIQGGSELHFEIEICKKNWHDLPRYWKCMRTKIRILNFRVRTFLATPLLLWIFHIFLAAPTDIVVVKNKQLHILHWLLILDIS